MNQYLIKRYLNNLSVNYLTGCYITVNNNWRDINYIPNYNKFYLIESGEGWLKIGDIELFPRRYQLVYMPANIKQSFSYINENYYTKYWCHYTAKIGERNIFEIVKLPFILQLNNSQYNYISEIFNKIFELDKKGELSSSLKIKSLLYELIAFYIDNSTIELNINLTPSSEWINKILMYIENHLHECLRVEDLAKEAHLHPNYFIKLFKSYVGTSPINYINNRRINKAKNLLAVTSLSITQVADKVGFKDSAYFSKVFKSYSQLTPRQYRYNIVGR